MFKHLKFWITKEDLMPVAMDLAILKTKIESRFVDVLHILEAKEILDLVGQKHLISPRLSLINDAAKKGYFDSRNEFSPIGHEEISEESWLHHNPSHIVANYAYYKDTDSLCIPAIGHSAGCFCIYKRGVWATIRERKRVVKSYENRTQISTIERVNIIPGHRVGNSTRQIDAAIQHIFKGHIVRVQDHTHDGNNASANVLLYDRILSRLDHEFNLRHLISENRIRCDRDKLEIQIVDHTLLCGEYY